MKQWRKQVTTWHKIHNRNKSSKKKWIESLCRIFILNQLTIIPNTLHVCQYHCRLSNQPHIHPTTILPPAVEPCCHGLGYNTNKQSLNSLTPKQPQYDIHCYKLSDKLTDFTDVLMSLPSNPPRDNLSKQLCACREMAEFRELSESVFFCWVSWLHISFLCKACWLHISFLGQACWLDIEFQNPPATARPAPNPPQLPLLHCSKSYTDSGTPSIGL